VRLRGADASASAGTAGVSEVAAVASSTAGGPAGRLAARRLVRGRPAGVASD
jgi:hypothetical protein